MTKASPYLYKYPGFFILIFLLFLFSGIFLIGEKILLKVGYLPGFFLKNQSGEIVETLIVTNEFYANEEGMFVANREHFNNPAKTKFKQKGIYYINSDGFRNREFSIPPDSVEKKILFLGDSFLWGLSAEPINLCFAERVDSSVKYFVYNTGIQSTGPEQYFAVAQKYIPLFKPEAVCLFFYMEDDIRWYENGIEPFRGNLFETNAGSLPGYKPPWIDGVPGEYFTNAQESYDYFLRTFSLFADSSAVSKFCLKFALTTQLYYATHPNRWIGKYKNYKFPEMPISGKYLKKIQALCRQHQAEFLLFIIPAVNAIETNPEKLKDLQRGVFEDFELLIPSSLNTYHYESPPGFHFNNEGHSLYAQFILQQLDSLFFP